MWNNPKRNPGEVESECHFLTHKESLVHTPPGEPGRREHAHSTEEGGREGQRPEQQCRGLPREWRLGAFATTSTTMLTLKKRLQCARLVPKTLDVSPRSVIIAASKGCFIIF